jgi:hypothetical protein
MAEGRSVFEAFLRAANKGDFEALGALLHPDFVETFLQSGERTHGGANLQAIIENYPGGYKDLGVHRVVGAEDRWVTTPSFTLLRIEGTGSVFTGVQKGRYADNSDWYVVSIAEMKDGLVWKVQTFFAPTFEPPAWRAQWVEVIAE